MSLRSIGRARTLKDLARDVAKPVTGPLDGRLADVIRRIETTRAVVERHAESVAAYASAAAETTSYFAVELRRFQVTLDACRESADRAEQAVSAAAHPASEEGLRARLDRAAGVSLADLDGSLARLINHAASHRGFAAQADLWFNPPVVTELSAGAARLSVVNERILEVPFAMGALFRLASGARVLDVGSTESTFALSAASLGFKVTAVDPRPLGYTHPNLRSVRGRIEDLDETTVGAFDAVFLISTVEHVGIGAYGQAPYGDSLIGGGADRAVIERVKQLLTSTGLLVLTTPLGVRGINELERTYDDESLDMLMAGFEVLDRRVAKRTDELTWISGSHPEPGERGVAMLLATPLHA